jgi:putative PIN family toxin of toxin-antitoxin system
MVLMLVVLDTNVLVSGVCRYEGSATYAVVQTMGREWDLAITPAIFLEYEDVLYRKGIRRLTGFDVSDVTHVLNYVAQVGLRTSIFYSWRPNLVDESDNKFVDCAVASSADYLVTGNVKDYRATGLGPFEFDVVTPRQFLKILGR